MTSMRVFRLSRSRRGSASCRYIRQTPSSSSPHVEPCRSRRAARTPSALTKVSIRVRSEDPSRYVQGCNGKVTFAGSARAAVHRALASVKRTITNADWQRRLTTLAAVVTAIAIIAGLFITNAADRDTANALREQQKLATDQYRLQERGQVTDRFAKAVDQLGADKIDTRLGAIYSLERLMKDSADDEPAILSRSFQRSSGTVATSLAIAIRTLPDALVPDIQASLTVLGRRPNAAAPANRKIDLSGARLVGAKIPHALFAGANLHGSVFSEANLDGADLRGVDMSGSVLANASVRNATLSNSDLTSIDLSNTNLMGSNLGGAKLGGKPTLTNANLLGANLSTTQVDNKLLASAITDANTVLPRDRPVLALHYNCPNDNSNIGKYISYGRYWQNPFTTNGPVITGGSLALGAPADGSNHSARVGIYGAPGIGSPSATVVVDVSGYAGVTLEFPKPLSVTPGQTLYLTAVGVGDFTAYDNTSGCLVGSVNGRHCGVGSGSTTVPNSRPCRPS